VVGCQRALVDELVCSCRYHSTMVLHAHMPPGGWTIGSLVAAVQRRSLTPATQRRRLSSSSSSSAHRTTSWPWLHWFLEYLWILFNCTGFTAPNASMVSYELETWKKCGLFPDTVPAAVWRGGGKSRKLQSEQPVFGPRSRSDTSNRGQECLITQLLELFDCLQIQGRGKCHVIKTQ
jgi:hypothetical protein